MYTGLNPFFSSACRDKYSFWIRLVADQTNECAWLKKKGMNVLSGWCTYLGRDSIRRLAASRPCTYTTWLCASTRQHSRELKLISHKGTYGVASNWSMHKAICQFIRSIKRTLLQLSFVGHWGVKDQCRAVSKKPTWYIFSLGILVWAMNRELVQHDGILLCLGDSAGSKQTFKIYGCLDGDGQQHRRLCSGRRQGWGEKLADPSEMWKAAAP
jgi:hypothetical protein